MTCTKTKIICVLLIILAILPVITVPAKKTSIAHPKNNHLLPLPGIHPKSAANIIATTFPDNNPIQGANVENHAPNVEWTFHKTGDNSHPDGNEQQAIWLMNRARTNPSQEGFWLANTDDPEVAGGRDYFGVNLVKLQSEFDTYNPKPPAAFDVRLYNAAKAHSDDLITRDAQDHNGQIDRVAAAGFSWWGYRGNVFAYASSSINTHAAWNIDWGNNDDGMQDGRDHRMAVMSQDGDYTNVGIAMAPDNDPQTGVGPIVATGNYCYAGNAPDHYNRFLVGTVWEDTDSDSIYDPGEGIGGVTVRPAQGDFYATTANSGGFALPITTTGTYSVTFNKTGSVDETKSITVGNDSVLLDLVITSGPGPTITPTPTETPNPTPPPPTYSLLLMLPLIQR